MKERQARLTTTSPSGHAATTLSSSALVPLIMATTDHGTDIAAQTQTLVSEMGSRPCPRSQAMNDNSDKIANRLIAAMESRGSRGLRPSAKAAGEALIRLPRSPKNDQSLVKYIRVSTILTARTLSAPSPPRR